MAQRLSQKPNTNFIKGLITERSELTFPEGASVDELNCELDRAGNRRRRLGLNIETSAVYTTENYAQGRTVTTSTWFNVGNESGVDFAVVQAEYRLHFYQKGSDPLSSNIVKQDFTSSSNYIVDLRDYQHAASTGAGNAKIQTASINGALVVVSPEINAFYIERDPDTGVFTETEIDFRQRDLEWLGDVTAYTTSEENPSIARQYDTKNAGWTEDVIDTYETSKSAYPPLSISWFSAKDSSNNFSVSEFDKLDIGTSLAANGRFIYNLFETDRSSNTSGATEFTESTRFSSVVSFSGRVFYSGLKSRKNSSRIYFSQFLQDFNNLGYCYQINDPTSEVTSDLLATDGGFISIPEAYDIKVLHTWGDGLYVFASNGVWLVRGVDGVFKATEYAVNKISDVGIDSATSFVSAQGRPYWWSTLGIHTITIDQLENPAEQNLSLSTIQTFWDDIDVKAKEFVTGSFDRVNKKIVWMYPNNSEAIEGKFNNLLFLHEELGAFYPWKVSDNAANNLYIVGATFYEGAGTARLEANVVDADGNLVVDSSGDEVVAYTEQRVISDNALRFLTYNEDENGYTFSQFNKTDFLDWGEANYSSFAEAGYDFMGDMLTFKNAPYIMVYLKTTEEGLAEVSGGYEIVRPSSMLVSAYWDFKTTSTQTQQAYRLKYPSVPEDTTWSYPQTVISTRLKVRGRGRSMRFRFESEQGKDFNLLGWSVVQSANTQF